MAHHGTVLVVCIADFVLGHAHRRQNPRLAILIPVRTDADVDLVRGRVYVVAAENFEDAIWLNEFCSIKVGVVTDGAHIGREEGLQRTKE